MGNISALIKWNLLYDVTDTELRRNDAVEKIQGNRNPFIDHPEYASYIWGDFNEKTQSIIDEYTYNITFDTNDGSSITSQEVLRNAKVVKPYTPIKNGFKFVGWYEDEALTKVYNFDNKVFSDRTLYAKWIEENKESPSIYQVTFDSNGGNEVTSLSVEEGLTINKPVNPKKINHEFSSWNLNGSPFDFSSPITSDINLTASWEVLERETSLVATSNYELVKDASTLKVGDKVVIGITSKEVVTGSLNGTYLSPLEAEFSSDASKINMIDENYLEFTLGGRSGAWTLSNNGKLLGCTAVKKLAFDSGITTWTISISGNNASIYSTNSSYGRILFNSSSPRFTTYTSNPNASMILPNLYKFIPSEEDLGPGGNNEFRNQTIETNLGFSYKCEEIVNDGAYLTKDIAMDFSLQGYQNAEEVKSLEKEGVTATFDIGSNPYNAPKYYNDGKSIRIYGGGTLTVSSESVITSIAITFGPSDGTNDITVNEGSYLSGMWSGRSTSITFKVSGLTGQRRIASIITTIETDEKGTVIEEDWTFSNFYMNFKTEINENVFDAQDENATFGLLIRISNDLEYNYDSVSLEEFDNLYNKENGYINIEFDKQDIKYENGKYILSSKIDNILEEQISTFITTVFYVKNTDSVVFSNVNIKSISTMIEMYLDYANNLELSDFEIKVLKALKKEYDL